MVLHTLPEELSVEIVLDSEPDAAQIDAIKKALTQSQGPFHKVQILKKL